MNIRRAKELERAGRMRPAGKKAFANRREYRSGIYSYEQRRDRLEESFGKVLRENKTASEFFDAQPPSYRKAIGWWVVCAKKDETRWKRLRILIEHSERGERIPQFTARNRDSRRG